MDIIYLLIPLALLLVILIVVILGWAIKSGQYDDLEGPAHQILMEDDHATKDDSLKDSEIHTDKPARKGKNT